MPSVTTDQVSTFLALLAVVAEVGAAALAVTLVVRLARPGAAWPRRTVASVEPLALALAATVATVATLGSLFYSEVKRSSRRATSAGTSGSACTRW